MSDNGASELSSNYRGAGEVWCLRLEDQQYEELAVVSPRRLTGATLSAAPLPPSPPPPPKERRKRAGGETNDHDDDNDEEEDGAPTEEARRGDGGAARDGLRWRARARDMDGKVRQTRTSQLSSQLPGDGAANLHPS